MWLSNTSCHYGSKVGAFRSEFCFRTMLVERAHQFDHTVLKQSQQNKHCKRSLSNQPPPPHHHSLKRKLELWLRTCCTLRWLRIQKHASWSQKVDPTCNTVEQLMMGRVGCVPLNFCRTSPSKQTTISISTRVGLTQTHILKRVQLFFVNMTK